MPTCAHRECTNRATTQVTFVDVGIEKCYCDHHARRVREWTNQ